jgi:hypothetical protein
MYRMNNLEPVCKRCPDRTVEPNCHETCERYKNFKATIDGIRKSKQDAYTVETSRAMRKRMSRGRQP